MKALILFTVICLYCSFMSTVVQAQQSPEPDLKEPHQLKAYCSGLIGNSLAFAFASGVSIAVPALSAGFLAASLALAVAAAAVC